jgi:hypothetical protein
LNPTHPVAATLVGFIGFALEQMRAELVAEHKATSERAAVSGAR